MRITGRRALSVLVAAGCLALSSGFDVASAHPGSRSDRNDTAGPLDISSTAIAHEGHLLAFSVTTFGRWRSADLTGRRAFYFDFDSRGNGAVDYYVAIFWDARLKANLWKENGDNDRFVTQLDVNRPDDGRTVGTVFNRSRIDQQGSFIRWAAISQFRSSRVCTRTCWDTAPNRGMISHSL